MTAPTSPEGQLPKAGPREWLGQAVVALPCLLYSMDLTVLHLAVPKLTADLRPSGVELLDLVVGSAPPEQAGAASAISETSAEFGGALGIALFGSIGVPIYRRMLDGALPAGVRGQR